MHAGEIIPSSGNRIDARIDTICMHGDTANAIEIAKAVRASLVRDGVKIRRLADKNRGS